MKKSSLILGIVVGGILSSPGFAAVTTTCMACGFTDAAGKVELAPGGNNCPHQIVSLQRSFISAPFGKTTSSASREFACPEGNDWCAGNLNWRVGGTLKGCVQIW